MFEAIYLYETCNSKAFKISLSQHAGILRFFDKKNILQCYINWPNFITRLCLVPKLFSKMCFVIDAWVFDDVMISEYLKS